MKPFLLICGLALLALTNPAKAAASTIVPADTVAGHARMVHQISDAMCTQLANDHTTAFDKMNSAEALQWTQQLFVGALQRDSVAFISFITNATKQGKTAQSVGQEMGKDVVILLGRTCPAAMPLIVRLSQTDQAQQAAQASIPAVPEAEKKALQPLVSRICTELTAANAKSPFAKLSAAQRSTVFASLMQQAFVAGRPQLLRFYGAAQLENPQRREEIGRKMASLMLQQNDCSGYLMQLGVDEMSK